MKIRAGFVSNSSSSSFCIIGVQKKELISELIDAEGKDFETQSLNIDYLNYGSNEGETVTFYGCDGEIYYVGISIKQFGENMTIEQMKKDFVKIVKDNLDVKIDKDDISLHYGEVGE